MNSLWTAWTTLRVAHPAHRRYDDDEICYFSVVKVQGGRFSNVKVVGFSESILHFYMVSS